MDSALPPIIIQLQGEQTGNSAPVARNDARKQSDDPDESSSGSSGVESALKRLVSFGTAKHFLTKIVQNQISTVELRTGAREYEQQLQFGLNLVSAGVGIAAAFAVNPAAGLAALTLYAVNTAMDISQRSREISIKESREDIFTGLSRLRAGFVNPVANGGRE